MVAPGTGEPEVPPGLPDQPRGTLPQLRPLHRHWRGAQWNLLQVIRHYQAQSYDWYVVPNCGHYTAIGEAAPSGTFSR